MVSVFAGAGPVVVLAVVWFAGGACAGVLVAGVAVAVGVAGVGAVVGAGRRPVWVLTVACGRGRLLPSSSVWYKSVATLYTRKQH